MVQSINEFFEVSLDICAMKDVLSKKIGVLGGGQLGRMMIQSGIDFNLDVKVLDPDPNAPCKDLVDEFVVGPLTDFDTVMAFGQDCDVITIEIENVNTEALKHLQADGKEVYPNPEAIELIQDKRKQKTFYKANRLPTAEFVLTENATEVQRYKDMLPAVNKLGREGYDGRGVQVLRSEDDLPKAFDRPGLLERFVPFEKELSVIVARNKKGAVQAFPVVELSYHPEKNLVEFLFSPAEISDETETKARDLATQVIETLDMVGLLAVEMFLTKEGDILINEIAPRTHNSGHHTIEGNITSQFEQHIRAILDLPLGSTDIVQPAAMVNLLGEDGYQGLAKYEGLAEALAMTNVHVHLYGKKTTKPFRKMGHVTITDPEMSQLKEKALKIKELIKIKA